MCVRVCVCYRKKQQNEACVCVCVCACVSAQERDKLVRRMPAEYTVTGACCGRPGRVPEACCNRDDATISTTATQTQQRVQQHTCSTRSRDRRFLRCEYRQHAKSQCRPSSRLMSTLEKDSPGIRQRFFNQKMEQKEPEKWMPSTQAKPTRRSANTLEELIQRMAHSAFLATVGMVWMASNSWLRSCRGGRWEGCVCVWCEGCSGMEWRVPCVLHCTQLRRRGVRPA